MIYSLKLINHFIELPKGSGLLGFDTQQISGLLTGQGFEVESMTLKGQGLETVVVGRIVTAQPHPNAGRLQVCAVDVGSGQDLTIVCGAPNARPGLPVAVALPGTALPGGLTIQTAAVRGVVSAGMLCSRSELGLPVNTQWDGEGIWELNSLPQGGCPDSLLASSLGKPVFHVLGLEDVLLDVGVTPNRADALCHYGLAREIRAGLQWRGLGTPWLTPFWDLPLGSGYSEETLWKDVQEHKDVGHVQVLSKVGFPAFFIDLKGVHVPPSPPWLRNTLETLGLSSINGVVDATNFVRVAYGHPSHAYDRHRLGDQHGPLVLEMRCAQDKEVFLGLDGKERSLHSQDVVVATQNHVHGLLGVLGGEVSKVDGSTTHILLEFAQPSPVAVRRTSRRHGRVTEASFIFEKGIDGATRGFGALQVLKCLEHVAKIPFHINGAFGAQLAPEEPPTWVDVPQRVALFGANTPGTMAVVPPTQFPPRVLDYFPTSLETGVGANLVPWVSQLSLLRCLCFGIEDGQQPGAPCRVVVPTWRSQDVVGTIHLVEEVVRMVGIDTIPATPLVLPVEPGKDDAHLPVFEKLAQRAAALGLTEVAGFQFMGTDDWKKLGLAGPRALGLPLKLLNPIVADEPMMQQTLVADLLRKAVHNTSFGSHRGALFAVGRTFQANDGLGQAVFPLPPQDPPWVCPTVTELFDYHPEFAMSYIPQDTVGAGRPTETPRMAIVVFGNRRDVSWSRGPAVPWAFQDLLSLVRDTLWAALGAPVPLGPLPKEHPFGGDALHPGQRALIGTPEVPIGWAGCLHPRTRRAFGLDPNAFAAEINLSQVLRWAHIQTRGGGMPQHQQLPRKFPNAVRDMAFVVPDHVPSGHVVKVLQDAYGACAVATLAHLVGVRVFDVYRGAGLGEGKKSLALTFSLGPISRTLLDAEISEAMNTIAKAVEVKLGGHLRSS